ncbi:Ankrd7 [Symbiodinium microadriaticum]|nr:Ankrd7 [Symbiodinium microadriaticum]
MDLKSDGEASHRAPKRADVVITRAMNPMALFMPAPRPPASEPRARFKPGPIPYRKKLLQSRAKPCPSPHLLQHAASEGFKDFSSSEAVRRLHHAAFCGSVASVQALLETLSSEDWCRACDAVGTSVLHAAVTGGPSCQTLPALWGSDCADDGPEATAPATLKERVLDGRHRDGVFQVRDRFDAGAELGEEEMSWTREYGEGGSFPFWSLGQPKVEIRRLAAALEEASGNGLAAVVLGCGLGLDVAYLAKAGKASALTAVAGVDFAWPAIQEARRQHGDSGQAGRAACFFHHFDVCELPAPTVPLDLIIDNTVFQNVHRSGRFDAYLESLCRISTPGHTVLHLNLMSREGMEAREEFGESMEYLNLPLLRRADISTALNPELWEIWEVREGHYDLKPEGAGFECEAFYTFGGKSTPGIPSWCVVAARI